MASEEIGETDLVEEVVREDKKLLLELARY